MKIYCKDCNKYLGEIIKANLRKNIKHICDNCYSKEKLQKEFNAIEDLFKGFKK